MDRLGDLLTTRPIQTGWEFTMELYLSEQFWFIDDPERQLGNGSVWTRTRTWTRSDSLEPIANTICLLTKPRMLINIVISHKFNQEIAGTRVYISCLTTCTSYFQSSRIIHTASIMSDFDIT
jgi:hypothetical protein